MHPAMSMVDGDGESESEPNTDEEPSVIVQLSNRVQDGTRCRMGSLDMCIQGKCQVKLHDSENLIICICIISCLIEAEVYMLVVLH